MRLHVQGFALAMTLALAGCLEPVTSNKPGAEQGTDAGGVIIPVAVCTQDSDCAAPVSPDPVCAPQVAGCEQGACVTKPGSRRWDGAPGACNSADQCRCQDLKTAGCTGAWQCVEARCEFKCGDCLTDLECPTGQICEGTDCGHAKVCIPGCRTSLTCDKGQVCDVSARTCGEPFGACVSAPGCQLDSDCPRGSICDVTPGSAQRACQPGCHDGSQCAQGEQCLLDQCMGCQNCPCIGHCRSEVPCAADGDCPAGTVCASEAGACGLHCVPGCHDDSQCRPDQACPPPPACDQPCGCDHSTCVAACSTRADCGSGQTCAPVDPATCDGARRCVGGCLSDEECGPGAACARADCGPCCVGTCQPITTCAGDGTCGQGEVCEGCSGLDARCLPGCRDAKGCGAGQICEPLVCDRCPCPAQCAPAPATCATDSECGLGMVCEAGPSCTGTKTCVPGCHDESQCPAGQACQHTECKTCPCPGVCTAPVCVSGASPCGDGLGCLWGEASCTNSCCQGCPAWGAPDCADGLCPHAGGTDLQGCALPSFCGPCCTCLDVLAPVCGTNYRTYDSPCEAGCAGVAVLHPGGCDPFEGLGCDLGDTRCAAGQYCRDTCPGCGADMSPRCTRIGVCTAAWDCPAGLPGPDCANGPTQWRCVNHLCEAGCP